MMIQPYYQHAGITLYNADCLDVLPNLPTASIDAVVTSPPYAMQRGDQYGGIMEGIYPQFTVRWLAELRHALKPSGSVLLNIREHVKDGEISDYVHRTRLAVRAAGWVECDELIWIKPNAPPVGSPGRPRRSWERILWFAPNRQPWCDPQANGHASAGIGMHPSGHTGAAAGQWVSGVTEQFTVGTARCPDYVTVATSGNATRGTAHPAAYPLELAAWLIRLVVPDGGTVCDPFMGSGTTARAAKNLGRACVGIEKDTTEGYCAMAADRLTQDVMILPASPVRPQQPALWGEGVGA